ncbi:MAG: cytochrome c family protein [Vicinamibacterales bacterium]
MKRVLTWVALSVLLVGVVGFGLFLYHMPPLFLIAPETFGEDMRKAAPPVDGIADAAERAIAERGRQLVMGIGCTGCHATNGPRGPDLTKYLAGGGAKITSAHGTYVSRNLTPDPETGLARRTDEEVKRVLRSGTFPDGHVVPYTTMPWGSFSHLTEEDRHAVVVYLRHLPAVKHRIPDPSFTPVPLPAGAVEGIYALKDYGIN